MDVGLTSLYVQTERFICTATTKKGLLEKVLKYLLQEINVSYASLKLKPKQKNFQRITSFISELGGSTFGTILIPDSSRKLCNSHSYENSKQTCDFFVS